MPATGTQTSPWAAHRRRGEELRGRHAYAAELLTLYLALLEVWEQAWRQARADQPGPHELTGWAVRHVVPRVAAATAQSGPPSLAAAVTELAAGGSVEQVLHGWLAGDEQAPAARYLARAVLRGPLDAVDVADVCAGDPAERGGRTCPRCGGRPQLSFRAESAESLVSGRRLLACARCGTTWAYSASTCAWCGETAGARRTVFAEKRDRPVVGREDGDAPGGGPALFPHLRIEACESCSRYLIDIDLGRDARAVPEVDELTALPLDLFAAERGLTKITPNLMGF
jgi:Protein involved in formate dehydrogenase formation